MADGVAELLTHGHGGIERAVAGFAGEAVVDAAAVEAGVEHEVAQAQCLLAIGDNHVAGLLGEFQVACGVAAVAQVPIAGHHELQFDGFVVFAQADQVVQLLQVQVGGVAFAADAALFFPHEIVQVEAAAHGCPAGVVETHAFGAGFDLDGVEQLEVEGAADVELADAAVPLLLVVQPAVGGQIEAEGLAAEAEAAVAGDAVAFAAAVGVEVDVVDLGAADVDFPAVELDVERLVEVGRAFEVEIEAVDAHGVLHGQPVGMATQVGGELGGIAGEETLGFQVACEAEAEEVEVGRVDVEIKAVACLAEAAVGVDAVAAEQKVEVGFRQVVVLIAQIGLAGEGCAGELAVLPIEQEVQIGVLAEAAVELHAAVHAALRQIGQHGGGVEAGAVNAGGDFAALEELEQGFALHFAAVCGGDFHLL